MVLHQYQHDNKKIVLIQCKRPKYRICIVRNTIYLCGKSKNRIMSQSYSKKYQEVYDLYQLCSNTKDLHEFCKDAGINYKKFMEWQRHQDLEDSKQTNSSVLIPVTVNNDVQEPAQTAPQHTIRYVNLLLSDGTRINMCNTTLEDVEKMFHKILD